MIIRWADHIGGTVRRSNYLLPGQPFLNNVYASTLGDVSKTIGRESAIDDSEGALSIMQAQGKGASSTITSDGQGVNSLITSVN